MHIAAGKTIQMHSERAMDLSAPRATFRFGSPECPRDHSGAAPDGFVHLGDRPRSVQEWPAARIADEGWLVRARRAHVKTTDNIHINGKTIHLG